MITYKLNQAIAPAEVARLYDAAGLNRPTRDTDRIARMLKNSNLVVSAWDGDKLVGIGRAITDYGYCCLLSDLAIDRAYQKHGIGTEIIDHIQKEIGDEVALIIQAAASSMAYYPRLGFEKMENGFYINRKR